MIAEQLYIEENVKCPSHYSQVQDKQTEWI